MSKDAAGATGAGQPQLNEQSTTQAQVAAGSKSNSTRPLPKVSAAAPVRKVNFSAKGVSCDLISNTGAKANERATQGGSGFPTNAFSYCRIYLQRPFFQQHRKKGGKNVSGVRKGKKRWSEGRGGQYNNSNTNRRYNNSYGNGHRGFNHARYRGQGKGGAQGQAQGQYRQQPHQYQRRHEQQQHMPHDKDHQQKREQQRAHMGMAFYNGFPMPSMMQQGMMHMM